MSSIADLCDFSQICFKLLRADVPMPLLFFITMVNLQL